MNPILLRAWASQLTNLRHMPCVDYPLLVFVTFGYGMYRWNFVVLSIWWVWKRSQFFHFDCKVSVKAIMLNVLSSL
jgi:hypothetical protein